MKIQIDELQKISLILFSKLKESKGNEIEISNDFYWDIADGELYNPYKEPTNMSLGQLSDDIVEIERILKVDGPIPYDLKRISNILKAISYENPIAF